jgi:Response regulator containing a CheY-like receiver domain and an HTH DNA-binding domain
VRISSRDVPVLRTIIASLYERPFDKALILEASGATCSLVEAQYHSLYLFPIEPHSMRKIVSNNTEEYLEVYSSVKDEDYLMASVLGVGNEYYLSRDPARFDSNRSNFTDTVQNARPVSDVAYLPLWLGADLAGVWTFAKAGLESPVFSEDDIDLLRFVVPFLNAAFERSLLPPPLDEDLAYLDRRGRILASGARIRQALEEVFGGLQPAKGASETAASKVFARAFRRFMTEPYGFGADRLSFSKGPRSFSFRLKALKPYGRSDYPADERCAALRLVAAPADLPASRDEGETLDDLTGGAAFSPRESEVIAGIRMGKSNKQIAFDLKVEEGTVKRYTHNIYEKTGFKSRVELLLGLPAQLGRGEGRHKPKL